MLAPAKNIRLGDTIKINLGKGVVNKIVDFVREKDGVVEIVLFSPNRPRPRFKVLENYLIEVE
jgi:hypothetical protein